MSGAPEIQRGRSASDTRHQADAVEDRVQGLDLIVCDGCGRSFATHDGPGMIAAIVGPCPECGGRFRLGDTPSPRMQT
jgi:hypothetical protein